MVTDLFEKPPIDTYPFRADLLTEYLQLWIVFGGAVVMEPFHGRSSFLESEVGLFDPVDQAAGFQNVVLFVVDVGDQEQGGFTKPRPFEDRCATR